MARKGKKREVRMELHNLRFVLEAQPPRWRGGKRVDVPPKCVAYIPGPNGDDIKVYPVMRWHSPSVGEKPGMPGEVRTALVALVQSKNHATGEMFWQGYADSAAPVMLSYSEYAPDNELQAVYTRRLRFIERERDGGKGSEYVAFDNGRVYKPRLGTRVVVNDWALYYVSEHYGLARAVLLQDLSQPQANESAGTDIVKVAEADGVVSLFRLEYVEVEEVVEGGTRVFGRKLITELLSFRDEEKREDVVVTLASSVEEMKKAYRRLVRLLHPDMIETKLNDNALVRAKRLNPNATVDKITLPESMRETFRLKLDALNKARKQFERIKELQKANLEAATVAGEAPTVTEMVIAGVPLVDPKDADARALELLGLTADAPAEVAAAEGPEPEEPAEEPAPTAEAALVAQETEAPVVAESAPQPAPQPEPEVAAPATNGSEPRVITVDDITALAAQLAKKSLEEFAMLAGNMQKIYRQQARGKLMRENPGIHVPVG